MPTAKSDPTTSSTDFTAAIGRMRAIATQSADHLLLGDGPPHPDAALLDICAEIGHQRRVADAAAQRWREADRAARFRKTEADRTTKDACDKDYTATGQKYAHLLRAAAKLKATTAAGIYAKAIAVRSSKTGAAYLATSMADDLIACEELRQTLWATNEGDAA
ncbi:hypothetical protein [Rhodopila sp.]|uniref:hypothetical protein n=1 Tax=Rhodopila sp. TaxID=2480087 RepID=UPI003D0E88DF